MKNTKEKQNFSIQIEDTCLELLSRTAERNNLGLTTLLNFVADSITKGLKRYGLHVPNIDSPADKGAVKGKEVRLGAHQHKQLSNAAAYLGCGMSDLLRDGILAQRFNFQRMQPINARNLSTIRMKLFELEQKGPLNGTPANP
jgi:hypothetical protein